jgi:hypothetical protein
MYVAALGCSYTQLALSIQRNSISTTTYVLRSAIEPIHQPHMFSTAQSGTVITEQLSSVYRLYRTKNMDSLTCIILH